MNKLKLPFSIGLICLIIGLISGYKLSPKPTHSIQTKIEYRDKIVNIDRVITKKPDGTIITTEKELSHELSHSSSKSTSKPLSKDYSLSIGKWSDNQLSLSIGYKLYETDKYSLEAIGSIKSNIIDLKNNEYMIGLVISYKLYETDKYSLEAIGSIKSNIIDLKNNEYMTGLVIRF